MNTLYTLLVTLGLPLAPGTPIPVVETPHLSYDNCQVLAQLKRNAAPDILARCVTDGTDLGPQFTAGNAETAELMQEQNAALHYTLHARLTVDGHAVPEITGRYATLTACRAELAKAQAAVDSENGRGTLDARCERQ